LGGRALKDLLLDTHTFLWFAVGDEDLSVAARSAIESASVVYVSAASACEIRTKHRLGKLPAAEALVHNLRSAVERLAFDELPITFDAADLAGALQGANRDPFDRILIAQAIKHELAIVSNEVAFDQYGVTRVW
jgi:PIN domain nuclease of toxin-antitoxin system